MMKTDGRSMFDDEKEKLMKNVRDMMERLEQINEGVLCLESEFDPYRYDDWDNDLEDEYMFSDPHGIAEDLRKAYRFIAACIDLTMLEEGLRLCKELASLKIQVNGDYEGYSDNNMDLSDLKSYELLRFDLNNLGRMYLYLTYVCSPLEIRADQLYCAYEDMYLWNMGLSDFRHEGMDELPQLDVFLPTWIDCLCRKERDVRNLLQEAASLITDEDTLLKTVCKHAGTHPELVLYVLQMERYSSDHETILRIGKEALSKISEYSTARSGIADRMASSAYHLHQYDQECCCIRKRMIQSEYGQ